MFKKKKATPKAEMQEAILAATRYVKNCIVSRMNAEELEELSASVEHLAQAFEYVSNSK